MNETHTAVTGERTAARESEDNRLSEFLKSDRQFLRTDGTFYYDLLIQVLAQRDELLAVVTKIAEREWSDETVSWRKEAIEMQDEARAAIANAERGGK